MLSTFDKFHGIGDHVLVLPTASPSYSTLPGTDGRHEGGAAERDKRDGEIEETNLTKGGIQI